MRIAFMGSPAFAVPVLQSLLAAGHDVACVYTQPPRPAGRGHAEKPTPVHAAAAAVGLPVRYPRSLKTSEARDAFAALDLDAAIVVAYGLILPQAILDCPRHGCLNLHASMLPRWRGAAPIQRALMAGDVETGVQVMQMEAGLDTGPVLLSQTAPILPDDTAGTLHDRLAAIGPQLMLAALDQIAAGVAVRTPQAHDGATYAAKILPGETKIDWTKPAAEVDRQIRGLSPAPGAWFVLTTSDGKTQRVKVLNSVVADGDGAPGVTLDEGLRVGCGSGAVRLLTLQREGRGPLDREAFLRGLPVPAGASLGG